MADRRVRLVLEAQVNNFNTQLARARQEADGLGGSLRQAVNQPEVQRMGRTLAAFGAATTAALGTAVKAAVDWESSWTNVMRRTEGTPQQLARLEEGLRGIAREMPATHHEIAEVAATAAQLGVGVEHVEDFTETMIMMGTTTNMSAEQAATSMARFANIMGTSTGDMDRLGSAIVDLGNNSATTESEIMDMSQRMAAAGQIVGMTEGDVLGFAAAMSSVGVESAAGGTAVSRTMLDINSAVAASGEELEGFADIAGMTAQEFADLWSEDPAAALDHFVQGLGQITAEGGDAAAALSDIGINEQRTVRALLSMAEAGDLLTDSLARGNDAFEENSAMAAEYAYEVDTVAGQMQIFRNRVYDAAIDIGAALLPVLEAAVTGLAELVDWFTNLPGPVQSALTWVTAIGGALALLSGTAIILAPGLFALRDGFRALRSSGGRAATVIGRVGRAAGIAAVALAGLEIANRIFDPESTVGTAEQFADAIGRLGTDGVEAEARLSELANTSIGYGNDLHDLNHALSVVDWGRFLNGVDSVAQHIPGFNSAVSQSEEVLTNYDSALAQHVSSGNLEAAGEGLQHLRTQNENYDRSLDEVVETMPQFESALYAAGIEAHELEEAMSWAVSGITDAGEAAEWGGLTLGDLTERMTEAEQEALEAALGVDDLEDSLDGMGDEAQSAEESMRDLISAMFDAGLIAMDARDAAFQYESSLRDIDNTINELIEEYGDLSVAVNENRTDFDDSTDAGDRANQAFHTLARDGMREVEAMALDGVGQDELQSKLQRTAEDLYDTAVSFGISEEAAADLTREVLGVPDYVDISSDMDDNAAQVAEWLNEELDRADGRSTSSSHTHTINERVNLTVNTAMRGLGLPGVMLTPGFSTGGAVRGPGGPTDDLIPARLSNGEHVLDAQDVQALGGQQGVYEMRQSLHSPSGRNMVPAYQGGAARQAGGAGIDYNRLTQAVSQARPLVGSINATSADSKALTREITDQIFRELSLRGVQVGSA